MMWGMPVTTDEVNIDRMFGFKIIYSLADELTAVEDLKQRIDALLKQPLAFPEDKEIQ